MSCTCTIDVHEHLKRDARLCTAITRSNQKAYTCSAFSDTHMNNVHTCIQTTAHVMMQHDLPNSK